MMGTQHKIVGTSWGVAGFLIASNCGAGIGSALIIPAAMIGCMLPDMDHDRTKLGRKRKVVTKFLNTASQGAIIIATIVIMFMLGLTVLQIKDFGIDSRSMLMALGAISIFLWIQKIASKSEFMKWATKHRGFMHTLVLPALLLWVYNSIGAPVIRFPIIGVVIGYCSHLFADMLTVEGCPVLFPLSRNNIHIMSFRASSKACEKLAIVVAGLSIVLALLIIKLGVF